MQQYTQNYLTRIHLCPLCGKRGLAVESAAHAVRIQAHRVIQAPHCQGHGHRAGTEATTAYQTFTVWKLHETVQAGRARRTYTIHNPEKFACPPRPIANGHGRRDEGTEAGKLLSTRSQGARCAGPLSLRVRVRDIGAWITALQKEHEPNPKL